MSSKKSDTSEQYNVDFDNFINQTFLPGTCNVTGVKYHQKIIHKESQYGRINYHCRTI